MSTEKTSNAALRYWNTCRVAVKPPHRSSSRDGCSLGPQGQIASNSYERLPSSRVCGRPCRLLCAKYLQVYSSVLLPSVGCSGACDAVQDHERLCSKVGRAGDDAASKRLFSFKSSPELILW